MTSPRPKRQRGAAARVSSGSAAQRYRRLVVGAPGTLALLRHEAVILAGWSLGGAPGRILRRLLYPLILGRCGEGVEFGRTASFRRPGRIRVGARARIGEGAILDVRADDGAIDLGEGAELGEGVLLSCRGGIMRLGDWVRLGPRCRLGSTLGLSLGAGTTVGEESCVVGAAHAYDRLDLPIVDQPLTCRGVTAVGAGVSIGPRATLRDGVTVGDGAIVEENALVLTDVPPGARVGGVPGRILGGGG